MVEATSETPTAGNTTNNGKQQQQQQQGSNRNNKPGVADYYAMLGVGEKLIWKHTQKQSMYAESSDDVEEEEEDEVALDERFYREIVQVSILAVDGQQQQASSSADTNASAPASEASTSVTAAAGGASVGQQQQPSTIQQVTSYTTESSSAVGAAGTMSMPLLPTSPSHSEATTATTVAPSFAVGGGVGAHHNITLQAPPAGVSKDATKGWTVLHQTLPARHSALLVPSLHQHQQQYAHHQQQHHNNSSSPLLWSKFQVWDANLQYQTGIRQHVLDRAAALESTLLTGQAASGGNNSNGNGGAPLKGLRRKMESTLLKWQQHKQNAAGEARQVLPESTRFYLAYQRRKHVASADDANAAVAAVIPAIADVSLHHVRIHKSLIRQQAAVAAAEKNNADAGATRSNNDAANDQVGQSGLPALAGQLLERYQSSQVKVDAAVHAVDNETDNNNDTEDDDDDDNVPLVSLSDYLTLPDGGFDEWSIPHEFLQIKDPAVAQATAQSHEQQQHRPNKTVLFEHDDATYASGEIGVGVEAVDTVSDVSSSAALDPADLVPCMVTDTGPQDDDHGHFSYIPVLAVRRQRVGDEERYHEDAGIVDLTVTFCDRQGDPVLPDDTIGDEDDDEEDENTFRLLGKTAWARSIEISKEDESYQTSSRTMQHQFGLPLLLVRRNMPFGFADAAFATRVLDRFPFRNYKGLPLPEEELPMFCYPTGCRLHRAQFSDAPLAQYYGFVVKNERGDSIYVSCVSFMEPLTSAKVNQLANISMKRRRYSLTHRRFCERRDRRKAAATEKHFYRTRSNSGGSDSSTEADSNFLLTGFDEMTTFENKTICLVSRYPFWTGFRKFLSHLHILSGSSSDIPLERCISHLLLSVPIPLPGGFSVLVPLPALNEPMVLWMPPEKDFPLVDLPYHRLMACLDIATVTMIVLGLLALERKIIVMSTRPSLVLDICELLRSLLFPFDLCAPYVPRLTEPFKSSLEFPGAIFVGIHDDGTPNGLATCVRNDLPEDSIIVDLDTGEVECSGDKQEFIANTWDIIPESSRTVLVSELETLCRDAGIVPGQEPLDSQMDSAFDVTLPYAVDGFDVVEHTREPLDDRAVRDAYLRFFCGVLGGYERYLVVPDADFLVSGDEWFDAKGFLASIPPERAPYLNNLVGTQLFQAFIQKRTEASDVHCMLFDECLTEFHASPMPYGRLGEDVETVSNIGSDPPQMVYSLLVDQAAVLPPSQDPYGLAASRSMDTSEAESSIGSVRYSESALNMTGDLVTAPSRQNLKDGVKYIYCIDGNPCFPHNLKPELFLPKEPETWHVEMSKTADPLLARSGRELEEANRRRRTATSFRSFQNQRRCLWQLPKLMGSHFLGSWLLCIPAQVSQTHLSHDQQSRYLLRALGALRLLRSKQRIVPDEAAYRALMVACGRARSDRRVELVKLFGLLRSDGIFPSAVTLGQYTKALAEGYSKRSSGLVQEDEFGGGVEVTESGSRVGRFNIVGSSQKGSMDLDACLSAMDGSLSILETQGRRWRQRSGAERAAAEQGTAGGTDAEEKKKRSQHKSWLPVVFSSSFATTSSEDIETKGLACIRLVALWSRTSACGSCAYIPLEEEVQAGWDILGEQKNAVACPRCGSLFIPRLGYKELSVEESISIGNTTPAPVSGMDTLADFGQLPPQIGPTVSSAKDASYVTYLSPVALRVALERYVEEQGEEVLDRERLRELDPEVFYNFWWYCARFSLPFPLPVTLSGGHGSLSYCAFAGWDQCAAERGCFSAAKSLASLADERDYPVDGATLPSQESEQLESMDEFPMLSRFNLQNFYSSVWDHPDLSPILVTLVEACDKRDFKPVIECILRSNRRRAEEFGSFANDSTSEANSAIGGGITSASQSGASSPSTELEVYRTLLYLAKYQCTTAFHAFFPATAKPCKGYHFWCAIGTPLPIFDRLVRDGVQRLNNGKESFTPIHDVSDVALGFRCVFGHLI